MILVFDEDKAYWWLIKVEQHFRAEGTHESQKLLEAVRALQGCALNWYLGWEWRNPNSTWLNFAMALLRRFQPEFSPNQLVFIIDEEPKLETLEKLEAENVEEEIETEDEGADAVVIYRFQATVDGGEEMRGKLTLIIEEEINEEGEGKGRSADLFGVDQTTPTRSHWSKLEMVFDLRCSTGEEILELSRSGSKEKLSSDHLLKPTNVRRKGVDRDRSLEKVGGLGNGLDGRCEGGGWDESEERHQTDGSSTATEVANSCTLANLPLPEPPNLDPRPTAEGQAVEVQADMAAASRSHTKSIMLGSEMDVRTKLELRKLGSLSDLMGQAQDIEGSNWASRNDKIGSHFGQKHRLH